MSEGDGVYCGEFDAFKRLVVESFSRYRSRAFDVFIVKCVCIGVFDVDVG